MGEKISDKIKYFMGVDNDEITEDKDFDKNDTNEFVQDDYNNIKEDTKEKVKKDKVYNISQTKNRMKVVVQSPKTFDESEQIVKNLLENKPVILNLNKLEDKLTNKVFDFCMGALCALQGHMIKIDSGIFLLAPNNIDVTGDIKEELESKGIFKKWI
mgnify:CR=1 FL=1